MGIHVPALILFGTDGCHLCDQAREIVLPRAAAAGLSVAEVDIAGDEVLEQRYGVRIPVLNHPATGAELGWPFDHAAVADFLSTLGTAP